MQDTDGEDSNHSLVSRSDCHWLVNRLTAISVCAEALEGEILDLRLGGPRESAAREDPVGECCRRIQSIVDEIIRAVRDGAAQRDGMP